MTKRFPIALAWAALAGAAAPACTSRNDAPDAAMDVVAPTDIPGTDAADVPPTEYPMPAAANAVARTDPRWEGQYRFLYDAFGSEVLDEWPPADFMLALMTAEPDVFGNQFERFGFVRDPNDEFPVGFKRGLVDRTRVHETCALCHVGRLDATRTWLGMPNTRLDFGRFRVEVSHRWVAAGHAPLLDANQERKALLLGPGRTNVESASYPQVVPADFPVYFTLGQRTHLNYMGTSGDVRTEVYLGVFSLGAGDPSTTVPFPPEARISQFLAFFGVMESPPPPATDPALVARGRDVFAHERCNSCHHVGDLGMDGVVTLDRDPMGRERFPGDDPAFPRGAIRTSALHRILQDGDGTDGGVDHGLDALIAFIFSHRLHASMTDGYRTNDLRGLAYTAPYLHNGSVPTLEALLGPAAARPATFMRDGFLVDTALPGNANVGHEFGAALSTDDRAALIEYLRSL